MLKMSASIALLALLAALQGCTTTDMSALSSAKVENTNLPSGTSGCIAPKIVTEQGECKEPEKLSWMQH